jgi:hypothetical protein
MFRLCLCTSVDREGEGDKQRQDQRYERENSEYVRHGFSPLSGPCVRRWQRSR